MSPVRVALIAHDAGGAEILSSYVRRLGPTAKSDFLFVLDGPARGIFAAKLGAVEPLPLDAAVRQSSKVLCGSGWQSDLELQAIALARRHHKKSTVFLDHWVNYRERFVRGAGTVLPDEIWVGDALALERARTALPEVPATLVENPYFLDIADEFRERPPAPVPNGLSVLFVCEPIREHALRQYGNERHWGYTEEEALRYFLDHVHLLPQPVTRIVVRPHPAEAPGKYAAVMREYGPALQLTQGRSSLVEDVAASHWVVGCNSMAMVVGLVAGRRVMSCIPPGGRPCLLPQQDILHLQDLVHSRASDA